MVAAHKAISPATRAENAATARAAEGYSRQKAQTKQEGLVDDT